MRTKGARDTKKRKARKDRKYKSRYKRGKFQPYFPKRNRNDPIKIWWWSIEPMSKDAYKRFPPHLRAIIRKTVFKKSIRVDVLPIKLSNKREIEELAIETLGTTGYFYLMMFCKRKNQFGVSPVKTASVKIIETPEGLRAKFLQNFRLYRYWFWEERRK
jgi:hypothetical protein